MTNNFISVEEIPMKNGLGSSPLKDSWTTSMLDQALTTTLSLSKHEDSPPILILKMEEKLRKAQFLKIKQKFQKSQLKM